MTRRANEWVRDGLCCPECIHCTVCNQVACLSEPGAVWLTPDGDPLCRECVPTWVCLGVLPNTPPCGAYGTEDRDAERHVKATGHGTGPREAAGWAS